MCWWLCVTALVGHYYLVHNSNFLSHRLSAFYSCSLFMSLVNEVVKGEVKPKIKFSPVVVFRVLSRMVLVRGSWDAPFLYSQSNSLISTKTGWLRPTRWGFVCKMSLKAPFCSYKSTDDRDWPICCSLLDAESTGFSPRMLYSQSNVVEQAVTCSCVHQSPGHRASLAPAGYNLLPVWPFFGCTPVTRVDLEWKLSLAGAATRWLGALTHEFESTGCHANCVSAVMVLCCAWCSMWCT